MQVYQGRLQGETYAELAQALHCSVWCIRKWSRRVRDEGLKGLQVRRRGRKAKGALSTFARPIAEKALDLKHKHPRWGADRVLVELHLDAETGHLALPSASRLGAWFRSACPELLRHRPRRAKSSPEANPPQAAHQVWQLDHQEKIRLQDGDIATVCNLRDPYGAAMIASQAFSVKTEHHYRKLHWGEVRQVVRQAFTEWGTLPEAIQTDNEYCFIASAQDTFPSPLTLWLLGLGVRHLLIRPHHPTEQAQVERNHSTLDSLTDDPHSLANLATFQAALDRERQVYNHHFPSRASDCRRQPPLIAHPDLLQPRRPYSPAAEHALFDPQRVLTFLAAAHFQRRVTVSGQLRFHYHLIYIGRQYKGQDLLITLDPAHAQWVFSTQIEPVQEILRTPAIGIDFQALGGLDPQSNRPDHPIQLSFPVFH
jgi:hypothetical protein